MDYSSLSICEAYSSQVASDFLSRLIKSFPQLSSFHYSAYNYETGRIPEDAEHGVDLSDLMLLPTIEQAAKEIAELLGKNWRESFPSLETCSINIESRKYTEKELKERRVLASWQIN